MSEVNRKSIDKKITRGKRGGKGKTQKNVGDGSLQEEVIKLLSSKGFNITVPPDKPSAKGSEKVELTEDEKICELFRKILKTRNCEETFVPNFNRNKVKENNFLKVKSAERKPKKANEKSIRKCTEQKVKVNRTSKAENSEQKSSFIDGKRNNDCSKNKAEKKEKKKKEKKKKKSNDKSSESEKEKSQSETKSAKLKNNKSKKDLTFPKCIRKRDMLQIFKNQKPNDYTYVKGQIRINPKNSTQAYISTGNKMDILISGIRDRNRAMDKDLVAAMINPEEEWPRYENGEIQKTGTVVCILEKIHPRRIVGTLSIEKDKFRLKSRDERVPCMVISPKSVPEHVKSSPGSYRKTLFLVKMDRWLTPYYCRGTIESIIGDVGDLEGETKAILLANGLDVTPYDKELLKELPSSDYILSSTDLEGREDWREECVFTIDPATAVDLDDALSCIKLPDGNYEVGVHISDVTHYLKAFSPLDEEVSKRATTVYLVNTVYHMLPKSLCNLCSLLPGHDKLSFSVIWEMTPEAEVINHRFVKSIINSSYQMSYEEAQAIIDEPSREWTYSDFPGLVGDYPPSYISETVNNLYKLSSKMRERRYADGALSINQPKLQIIIDRETSIPTSYRIEERRESNRLVEEFMLLANMTVAEYLYQTMADTAFLRSHGEPLKRLLSRTADDLGHLGVHLNIESAASLQASLSLYENTGLEGYDDKFATNCRMMVINALCAQSMPRAVYLCSGMINGKEDLRHFALNVPFYTHFTSPIRRYADCVVHRLLFASITNKSMPKDWSADLCAKIAANCNGKKYSAKIAQEKSNELYFMDLLSRKGPTETMAIVMEVKQWYMNVILCHVGITIKMSYSDFQKNASYEYNKEHSVSTVIVKWKDSDVTQIISVFSIINLRIEKHPKKFSIRGLLLPTRLNDESVCK